MLKYLIKNGYIKTTLHATIKSSPFIHRIKTHKHNKLPTITKMYKRNWQSTISSDETDAPVATIYKLLSYNILAQDLLTEHMHLYLGIDVQLLRWEHRLRRLTQEILTINPDILCLQEMQFNHLKGLVRQIKDGRKLEYVFKKKTGHRTDGCAIIYDKDKFTLIEERALEYHIPGKAQLNRENIALMAKFRMQKDPTKHLIIATTHLLYNPKRDDVRMAQAQLLLATLNSFALHRTTTNEYVRLPILLTGDFNCEPQSPPYSTLTSISQIPRTWQENCSNEKNDYLQGDTLKMLPLDFGHKSASTFQNRWILVDYIFYATDKDRAKLKVCGTYKLPSVGDCSEIGYIPNRYFGSDHYSLAIAFSID